MTNDGVIMNVLMRILANQSVLLAGGVAQIYIGSTWRPIAIEAQKQTEEMMKHLSQHMLQSPEPPLPPSSL
jgi:hypothetical protein